MLHFGKSERIGRMSTPTITFLNFKKALFLGLFLSFLFFPDFLMAAEKPTKNLEKAVKSGKKVILFEGKENEDFTIRSGVTVTGTNPEKAIISGDIKLENGVTLSNVTVSGNQIPITIAKGANVTLINVTVRGGKDAGIVAQSGGGTLTVRNSRIINNRKGLYVLDGKNLSFSGNVVGNNKEEGLDMRIGTTGTLSGNQFVNNGEGGAEIIAGSARLVIQNNTFRGNKADGLTIQTYSGAGKALGNIRLSSNTFADNRSFGLACGSPSGGGAPVSFYPRTISAIDNVFRNNKLGSIDGGCGGLTNRSSVQKEEKKEEEIPEVSQEELRAETREVFEVLARTLHTAEYALEQGLHERQGNMFQQMFRLKPVAGGEKEKLEAAFVALDREREAIATFPRTDDPSLEDRRQSVLIESLRREGELRSAFDVLQKKSFPNALLMFFF